MPLEIKRQQKETSHALVRRFIKRLRQSGILRRTRRKRYKQKPLSHQIKKRVALRRVANRKEQVKARKLGKPK